MQIKTIPIASGSPGTNSELTIWHYKQGLDGPKVYLQAGLHADEWPGLLTLHHLHHLLATQTVYGEIVIVPYANPIGLRQFLGGYQLGRFDFDYSGNFNRGFLDLAEHALPYLAKDALASLTHEDVVQSVRQAFKQALEAWQPALESEHLRKTLQLLSHDADFVLDLHCDAQACVHAFVNRRHQATGEQLAQCLDAKALILEDDPGGMAFDDAMASAWWRLASKLDISLPNACFAATIELRGERDIDEQLAKQDAQNIGHFLAQIGSIGADADEAEQTEIKEIGAPLAGVARVTAPHSGLIVYHVTPGDKVAKNALVAEIIALDNPQAARTPLLAPTSGIVYALARNHMIRTGHVVVQIAGNKNIGDGRLAF